MFRNIKNLSCKLVSVLTLITPYCDSKRDDSSFSSFDFDVLQIKAPANAIIPCSIYTKGNFCFPPLPIFEVAFCDFKVLNSKEFS